MNRNIKELIEYPAEGILSREIIKNEKIDTTLFCMTKGTEMSEHTSTKKGIIYIIEGEGIFRLEGKDIKMQIGTFIFMNENSIHSLKVEENTSFILTLIK